LVELQVLEFTTESNDAQKKSEKAVCSSKLFVLKSNAVTISVRRNKCRVGQDHIYIYIYIYIYDVFAEGAT
jgi:hypothetical protein